MAVRTLRGVYFHDQRRRGDPPQIILETFDTFLREKNKSINLCRYFLPVF